MRTSSDRWVDRMNARIDAFAASRQLESYLGMHPSRAAVIHTVFNIIEAVWKHHQEPPESLVPDVAELQIGGDLSPREWLGNRGRPLGPEGRDRREKRAMVSSFYDDVHGHESKAHADYRRERSDRAKAQREQERKNFKLDTGAGGLDIK